MKITAHFHSEEFDQPARHGLPLRPYPEKWIEYRLRPLCEALEVIRTELGGRVIAILSGYRSEEYNRKINGARLSQHVEGRAADIQVSGYTAAGVEGIAMRLYAADKLRIGGLGLYPTFVHVDVRQGTRLARWTGGRHET